MFEKFEDAPAADKPHVVLHNPGDSGNVGTILRTALGLGLQDAALIRPCCDPFDPRSQRASMGAFYAMNVKVYDSFGEYASAFPGRSLSFFMIFSGGISIQPVSEESMRYPSLVMQYLEGRRPFLSRTAPMISPSEKRIDAGPSHGSIIVA